MAPTATSLINHLGYAGLGAGLVLSTLGLFSSEVLLLLAAVAIRQGSLNLIATLIIAIIAQLAGALISYTIGRYGGAPLIERYGRYVLLSKHDLERAHRWFGRYGRWAATLGYCLPLLRGYIGYAAGIAAQSARGFTLSAIIGTAIWTGALITLGYHLAAHLSAIERVIRPFSYTVAAVVLLVVVIFFWHRVQEVRA